MEYILKCLSSMINFSFFWIGYVHIYGISLSLYKDEKKYENIWDKIKGLKKGVIFWGACIFIIILLNPLIEDTSLGLIYCLYNGVKTLAF